MMAWALRAVGITCCGSDTLPSLPIALTLTARPPGGGAFEENANAGRRGRAVRRRAGPGRGDRALHEALRAHAPQAWRVEGVRLQERDPAHGDRTHRAPAADR